MNRNLAVSVLAAAALLAGAPAALAAPPVAPPAPGFFGVMADGPLAIDRASPTLVDSQLLAMAEAGVTTVRTVFYWRDLEPRQGELELAEADHFVGVASDLGMRVMPVILSAPRWAAAEPGAPSSQPTDPNDLRSFAERLARRYGEGGTLKLAQPIRDWQIWNEPHFSQYWSEKPWAPSYVAALKAARLGLRGADPNARVVLAGMTSHSWDAIEAVYEAGGRNAFDVAAIHPFTGQPARVLDVIRRARKVMTAHGDEDKPLTLTEVAWASSEPGPDSVLPTLEAGLEGQAARLEELFAATTRNRERYNLERVLWYTWLSRDGEPTDTFDHAGLRTFLRGGEIRDKPAFAAFSRAAALRAG